MLVLRNSFKTPLVRASSYIASRPQPQADARGEKGEEITISYYVNKTISTP